MAAAGCIAANSASVPLAMADGDQYFNRIASIPVFLNTDVELETVAEIVAATDDGNTLVYSDSAQELIGFIDISDPANPLPAGTINVGGEPTSVAVARGHVLVAVVRKNSKFTNPKGDLKVYSLATRRLVKRINLKGQPDAIAVSPNQRYAGVAIENERDEDLGDGRPGQKGNPPGKVVIIDLPGNNPRKWRARDVNLLGISEKFPNDPEPEFIDINSDNVAVVTMQEDNHLVLINLRNGRILDHYPAGTVDLEQIDATEDDIIRFEEALVEIPREADAVAWLDDNTYATADEGDLDGGSRGFTIYNKAGEILYTSGNDDDQLVGSLGHYPEGRSENKGNEPEGIEYGQFGDERFLFVGSERSSVISVYELSADNVPSLKQVLPAGVAPEGLLAIPDRNLFVVASEDDARDDKIRSAITIYELQEAPAVYPTVVSVDRDDATPIPWGALSALAGDPDDSGTAWTVYDSFYKKSRIFELSVEPGVTHLGASPAVISSETVLSDDDGVFEDLLAEIAGDLPENPEQPNPFDPSALLNEDGTVNLDPEGLAVREDGGFWLASEGNGTIGDEARPIKSLNWILGVSEDGVIEEIISLPDDTNARQVRFGLEGVTSTGSGDDEVVYACFQREWGTGADDLGADPAGLVRIGRYAVASGEWSFFYYPLDAPESPNGGWIGLSEIVAIDEETFLILERDNQGGPDAAVKRIYQVSIGGVTPLPEAAVGTVPDFPVLEKELVRDIYADLAATNGAVIEKVEGLTVLANGDALIVTDNDGVDDSSGETQLINLGDISADSDDD